MLLAHARSSRTQTAGGLNSSMGLAFLPLLLAIEIRASGDCPGGADVQRKLAPLLEAGTAAGASDIATIKRGADGSLLVALDDAAGRSIQQRRFPRAGTCSDQAETVAVTLAIWEAQIHPEISLRLDRLSPAAPPATVVTVSQAAAPAPRAASVLSLGLAGAGDWQSGAWAPAGRLELGFGRAGGRGRVRLALVGSGPHTQDVPPGQARWWRGALSLGAEYDVARGDSWALVLGGGALGGVAAISGVGFSVNRTSRSLDVGGEARARAEWRPGVLRPWVGAALTGWLRRQGLDLQGVATAAALPRVEPAVAVGVDFVW
jgi:hypothetical protein